MASHAPTHVPTPGCANPRTAPTYPRTRRPADRCADLGGLDGGCGMVALGWRESHRLSRSPLMARSASAQRVEMHLRGVG
eukprot:4461187-Prymnesium_polylepis.1